MYVCICMVVTSAELRSAVQAGASSLDDLRAELGVTAGCGGCTEEVECLLQRHLSDPPAYGSPQPPLEPAPEGAR